MRIHHLNAGTMCPLCARLVNGRGGLFERARLVCHVLLLETNDGLVLVDTGIGLDDIATPVRLQRFFLLSAAPRLQEVETARRQVEVLGFAPDDVRHIVLTHLDRDHAGGLADFGKAKVHVHVREHQAAVTGELPARAGRYIKQQWAQGPDWVLHGDGGDDWFGFSGVRALGDREPDVLLIPLFGHTPGHCGVAVRRGDRWLLHAGDSHYAHRQIETPARPAPPALGFFQGRGDSDRAARLANQERLRVLAASHSDRVTVICSHDPDDFDRCRAATAS